MLYITYKKSVFDEDLSINNVWNVKSDDVEQKYIDFMQEKAKELNIVINPHWLNVMAHENHNPHLSMVEYKNKEKQWEKIKKQWNIDKFISEILKGTKQNYKHILRF